MLLPQFYITEVKKNEKLNDNTILLELGFRENEHFYFKSGQFVLVYRSMNGKDEKRAFSVSSRSSQKTIELLIRKYDGGTVSPLLFDLTLGDQLKIRGPFGFFNLRKSLKDKVVFIGAGTGIAPLRSMMYEVLECFPVKKVMLIFGFRRERDFFFKDEFERLAKNNRNFTLHACATQTSDTWPYQRGRVTRVIPNIISSPHDQDVYLCGPPMMINDTLSLLINGLGFTKDQIIIERWGVPNI